MFSSVDTEDTVLESVEIIDLQNKVTVTGKSKSTLLKSQEPFHLKLGKN